MSRKIRFVLYLGTILSLLSAAVFVGSPVQAAPAGVSLNCQALTTTVPSVDGGPANLTMAGTLCRPTTHATRTVQLLVHGATYNRVVWNWPQDPARYSYVQAAARAGYATFSVDRLGHGKSAHPASSDVTIANGTTALHGIVNKLRSGNLGGQAFKQVVWVGHSLGAVYAYEYGSRYSDITAFVLAGSVHFFKQSWFNQINASFEPTGSDPGYLTTKPGTRGDLFYYRPTADPAVIAMDEKLKDTVTVGELETALPLLTIPADQSPTQKIRVPVLIAMGDHDNIVCGDPDGVTCTKQKLLDIERPYFTNAQRLDAITVANTGHDISLHITAPAGHAAILRWIRSVTPPR